MLNALAELLRLPASSSMVLEFVKNSFDIFARQILGEERPLDFAAGAFKMLRETPQLSVR